MQGTVWRLACFSSPTNAALTRTTWNTVCNTALPSGHENQAWRGLICVPVSRLHGGAKVAGVQRHVRNVQLPRAGCRTAIHLGRPEGHWPAACTRAQPISACMSSTSRSQMAMDLRIACSDGSPMFRDAPVELTHLMVWRVFWYSRNLVHTGGVDLSGHCRVGTVKRQQREALPDGWRPGRWYRMGSRRSSWWLQLMVLLLRGSCRGARGGRRRSLRGRRCSGGCGCGAGPTRRRRGRARQAGPLQSETRCPAGVLPTRTMSASGACRIPLWAEVCGRVAPTSGRNPTQPRRKEA